MSALALEMDGHRFGRHRDLPRMGERSAEILAALGDPPDKIAVLLRKGVTGDDQPG